jgi:hypothetical protein
VQTYLLPADNVVAASDAGFLEEVSFAAPVTSGRVVGVCGVGAGAGAGGGAGERAVSGAVILHNRERGELR